MSERVAIIAVHGVGGPAPDTTARSVADLLVRYQPNGAHFGAFEERRLTIPTSPVTGARGKQPDAGAAREEAAARAPRASRLSAPLRALTEAPLRALADDRSVLGRSRDAPSSAGVAFMRAQLQGYEDASERLPYETVELVGERVDPSGTRSSVHLFEMYWADLSRLGSGLFRVLGAVYQLILHISHLGRKTLDVASQYAPEPRDQELNEAWQFFAACHAWVVRVFTIGVPVGSLLMLCFGLLFIPAAVTPPARLGVGIAATASLALVLSCVVCFRYIRSESAAEVYLVVFALIVGMALWTYAHPPRDAVLAGSVLLTVSIGLVTAAAFETLLRLYERARPGALGLGRQIAAVVLLATVSTLIFRSPPHHGDAAEQVRRAAFFALQWSYVALMLVWIALWSVAFVALWAGARVRRRTTEPPRRERLRRAAWTARVTLSFSLVAFIVMALVGYESLVALATRYAASFDLLPQPPLYSVTTWFLPGEFYSARGFFEALIAQSGTSALLYVLIGLGIALLLVAWFIVLIALTSLRVPPPAWPLGEQLGRWLTAGFRWLRISGDLATVVVFGFFMVGGIVAFAPGIFGFQWPPVVLGFFDTDTTMAIVRGLAYGLLASAATVATVQLRLAALATRARPALGIVLDVDHYLRESPEDGTPRAKIAERFASLLRHVTARRREGGEPYFDRVVLVAHSQGTVITSDLLRFLTEEQITDPPVSPERFRLITMGSPLRQLYAASFPHLYEWVDASADRVPPPPAAALADRSPDPDALRVGKWVNLYTTGDYVGRTLWRTEEAAGVWRRETAASAPDAGTRRERCLGAGTHTHYWTSAGVAEELDALIQ